MVSIGNDWDEILADEWQTPSYLQLREFLKKEYAANTVYPAAQNLFNALRHTSFADTKVVILGQDPYHEPGQAMGLSFSVPQGVKNPPSLENIYKELEDDLGVVRRSGDLTDWAKQGVLLLNTVLSVRAHAAASHRGKGWEAVTDRIISELNAKQTPVVFLLWGSPARQKAALVTNPIHRKLETVHPSPLSAYRGFFGCRHFSKANEILSATGQTPIDWGENR